MFEVKNQVVMITGASGGIGLSLAIEFAKLEAKLILVEHTSRLDRLIKENIEHFKIKPLILKADLTNDKDVDLIVSKAEKEFGRIDILVNCAGVNIRKKMDEYTSEEWDWILNTNLKSSFNLSRKISLIMKKHLYGRIINISSIQGLICWFGTGDFALAPYCASKAGLISLTKSFALDLAKYNITVNAICPGVVEGKWAESLQNDETLNADILYRTPMKRFVKNSDLTGPVIFLSSKESGFVTGQSIPVDGGWTIQ
jgi:NAD(P)-dependent dehydrogenase (short-subunit alcohol dehydrogenase family)